MTKVSNEHFCMKKHLYFDISSRIYEMGYGTKKSYPRVLNSIKMIIETCGIVLFVLNVGFALTIIGWNFRDIM